MHQKDFAIILFVIGIFVISSLIIGGTLYISKIKPELAQTNTSIEQRSKQPTFPNNSINQTAVIVSPTPIILTYKIQGKSMLPNYEEGQIWEIKEYASNAPARSEVIKFINPANTNIEIIKRIVGIPGDKIKTEKGQLYLNDKLLVEPYLASGTIQYHSSKWGVFLNEGMEYIIPPSKFFIMGDNRENSTDSQDYGPIDKSLIRGKLVRCLQFCKVSE